MTHWAIAGLMLCTIAGTAAATTLPPEREPATLVSLMPVLPPAAATRSERDYFQAPTETRSGLAGWFSCRIAATSARAGNVAPSTSCD
jgi:hypothetical protein